MLVAIEEQAVVAQEAQVVVPLEEQPVVTEAPEQGQEYEILLEQARNPIEGMPLLDQALSMV